MKKDTQTVDEEIITNEPLSKECPDIPGLWLSFCGLLLILIDINITTKIKFPLFEEFFTEAPLTVSMVIDDVLGHYLRLDLLPDALGFLFLLIGGIRLFKGVASSRRSLCLCVGALILSVFYQFLPFFLNGNVRYRIGYFSYFIVTLFEIIAIFEYVFCFLRSEECLANHSTNRVTTIFWMVSCLAGYVHFVLAFYQLKISSFVYFLVQAILFGVVVYRLWKGLNFFDPHRNSSL